MTAKEASATIGMNYDSLTELLRKYPAVRDWLNPTRERGAWVYSDATLPKFQQLAELHKTGISLASIAKAVDRLASDQTHLPGDQMAIFLPGNGQLTTSVDQTPPVNVQLTMTNDQIALFAQLVTTVAPPPDDALLSMKAAHELTGIPYGVLRGLRVEIGKRLYIRRSDALRLIQEAKKP